MSDAITARNRANALKSTGPRTEHGKSVVAGNAVRHGATSSPDLGTVAAWLAIILDDPDIAEEAFLPRDERDFCALALAQAEVRLVTTERALRDVDRGPAEPSDDTNNLRQLGARILEELEGGTASARAVRSAHDLLSRIARAECDEAQLSGDRYRLLTRYLADARAQHRRAFRAWLAADTAAVTAGATTGEDSHFPKQSQNTTLG